MSNALMWIATIAYFACGIAMAMVTWFDEIYGSYEDEDYLGLTMDVIIYLVIVACWPVLVAALLFGVLLVYSTKTVVLLLKRGRDG